MIARDTQLVVLGSFPGVASLAAQQYYGHPRNQFWRLAQSALGVRLTERSYAERKRILKSSGVAVWTCARA